MRTKKWEQIYAAINRECAKAPYMHGELITRQATPEELEYYRKLAQRNRTKKKYFKLQGGF